MNIQLLPTHLLKASSSTTGEETATASAAATKPTSMELKNAYVPPESVQSARRSPSPDASPSSHNKSNAVVQHDYHDHANDYCPAPSSVKHKAKGGVIIPFPVKLHSMLDAIEADGYAHVVSWQPHGRCFLVHKPKEFVGHIMPKYFKQSKMASFQRQLNLYGFNRLTGGIDKGGYYHELFLKGKVTLAYDIQRMRVKGTGVRLPTNPDSEPNFYSFPPVSTDGKKMPALPLPMETTSSSPSTSRRAKKTSQSAVFNLEQRHAQLQLESYEHTRKIRAATGITTAKTAAVRPFMTQNRQQQLQREGEDVIFFEGCPFHYLDPEALAPAPDTAKSPIQVRAAPAYSRPTLHKSSSTVVSESDDSDSEFLPSFSAANMDWEGPLSSPSLQAHMRRPSFQTFDNSIKKTVGSLEDDIESFFSGFDMPVERYHEQIEKMSEDDDTAFGFLLEQAISE